MKLPLWRRGQDRDLDEEIESHLRLEIADRVERGEPVAEATLAARRQFGNITVVKEVTREMWGWVALERLAYDIRYALRGLRKTPGFAAVAIVTFALGIGANTAMFSVINAVMLRPLPFPEPDRLVDVAELDLRPGQPRTPGSASWPNFFDWRTRARSFAHVSAYHETAFTMVVGGRSSHTPGAVVSADLFATLGAQPALGRGFRADEERAGADVVVLSDGLWRTEFGGSSGFVGSVLSLNGRPFTVIGVMPPGFRFPFSTPAAQLWITVADEARAEPGDSPMTEQRGAHYIKVIGRLQPGVSVGAAQSELDGLAASLAREYPDSNATRGIVVTPQLDRLVGDTRRALIVLLVAVACVLLIACVNVANLLLVRGAGRGREIALRLALGASRHRLIVQLLTESVVLAAAGTVAGLLLAVWSVRALTAIAPVDMRGLDQVTIDGAVLAFTAAIGFTSALAFGSVPALVGSGTAPAAALAENARASTAPGQTRVRSILVIAETALGVVLLVAAGLLVRSFYRLAHTNPGFDPSHVVTARFSLPDSRYSYLQQVRFYDELLAALNAAPGLQATGATPLPMSGSRFGLSIELPGESTPHARLPSADFMVVAPGFFRAMQIAIVAGRDFTPADNDGSPRVIAINEAFARRFFPDRDPIGQRVKLSLSTTEKETPWREVVAVVRDFKQLSLTQEPRPADFVPYAQGLISPLSIVIRTAGPTAGAIDQLRDVLGKKDPELALYDVRTIEEYVDRSVASARFQMLLLTLFAALALVLTAVGLYGVVAYAVAQRTREFGIRIALGARPAEVLRLVARTALGMAAAGIALGIVGAAAATRLLDAALYGVRPLDPVTFVSVVALLVIVALVASWVPARRATRVDPILALRSE
jgi:putative ABC transport system permease protein